MNDTKEAERWLPQEHPDFLRTDPFLKPYQEDGRRCWRLWRSAVVNWDGGFAPCCYLTDKEEDFGEVTNSSIKEIWNNENYTTARGLFEDGYKPEKWVGCVSCSVYLGSRAARKRGPMALQREPTHVAPAAGPVADRIVQAAESTSDLRIPLPIGKVEEQGTK